MVMMTAASDTLSTTDSISSYDSIMEEKEEMRVQKRLDMNAMVTKPGGEMSSKFRKIFCKHKIGKNQRISCATPLLAPKETPRLALLRTLKIWFLGSEYRYFVRSTYFVRDANGNKTGNWQVLLYMWIRDRQTLDYFVRYGAPWRSCVYAASEVSDWYHCSIRTHGDKGKYRPEHFRKYLYRDTSGKKRFEMMAQVWVSSKVHRSYLENNVNYTLDDMVTVDNAALFQIFEYTGFYNVVMLDPESKKYWHNKRSTLSAEMAQYYSDNGMNIFHARS